MIDARWLDVDADVNAAVGHFNKAVALSRAGGFDGEGLERYRAEMALMHAMQTGHTAVEAAMLRILRILDEERPTGEDWHARLIDRLARAISGHHERPALLSVEIATDLHETRSFRHRVTHSYGNFHINRSGPALAAAARLSKSLWPAIDAFKKAVDPE